MDKESTIREALDEILGDGIVLAVRMNRSEQLVESCRAALKGGLRILEITLTTPGALDAIRELVKDERAFVGAGTVLTIDDARAVADAGGRFALSPVFDAEVLNEAHALGLLTIPGAGTATEILTAHHQGAQLVKVFPAGPLGGPEFLRKIRGPLPHIPLIPTSGPNADNFRDYLDAGAVAVGVGNEVFAEGSTLNSVESTAREVRRAWESARSVS